jgi:hypothetical protein
MRQFQAVFMVLAVLALVATSVSAQQKERNIAGPFGEGLQGPSCASDDISGEVSVDELGDADNTVINQDLSGSCTSVDDIGWSGVIISTVGASWGSEARLQVSASDGTDASSIQFTTATTPGTFGPVTGNLGASVSLLGDMVLRLEFFETFDDNSNSTDATYQAGTIDVAGGVIPVELQEFEVD